MEKTTPLALLINISKRFILNLTLPVLAVAFFQVSLYAESRNPNLDATNALEDIVANETYDGCPLLEKREFNNNIREFTPD